MDLIQKKNMNTKVLLGVSGGVDSAIAAHILLSQGYDVTGVYLYMQDSALEGIEDARAVCEHLNIPFLLLEAREFFAQKVIAPFIEAYQRGETPNPCVNCNETVKFKLLFDEADRLGAQYVATGHYAQIDHCDRFLLKKGEDRSKDQSYMLYRLKQDQLSRILFPLGDITKEEVRIIARSIDLPVHQKKDSQDICFIPTGDHLGFLKEKIILNQGNFIYEDKVIGAHKGIEAYTLGQRRGLGISHSHPLYVHAIDPQSSAVYVGKEEELFSKLVYAKDLNFIYQELSLGDEIELMGKIRYSQKAFACKAQLIEEDLLMVHFDTSQRAPTPGQSLVLYKNDYIFGGGIIKKTSKKR